MQGRFIIPFFFRLQARHGSATAKRTRTGTKIRIKSTKKLSMLPRQSLPRLPSRAVKKQLPRRRKTAFRNYLLPDGIFFFPPCVYGPRNDSETLFKKDSRAENLPFEVFLFRRSWKAFWPGGGGGGARMQARVSGKGIIVVACPTRQKKTKMFLLKFFLLFVQKKPFKRKHRFAWIPFFPVGNSAFVSSPNGPHTEEKRKGGGGVTR